MIICSFIKTWLIHFILAGFKLFDKKFAVIYLKIRAFVIELPKKLLILNWEIKVLKRFQISFHFLIKINFLHVCIFFGLSHRLLIHFSLNKDFGGSVFFEKISYFLVKKCHWKVEQKHFYLLVGAVADLGGGRLPSPFVSLKKTISNWYFYFCSPKKS